MTGHLTGVEAPDFTLTDQHGRRVVLSDFRGTPVLLVFVPFAFSDVCTNELVELRDSPDLADGNGLQIVVVSCDSIYTLKAWADAHGYTAPLLSDFWPHGGASTAYGVFNDAKGLATRGTFLIDASGEVAWSVVNPTGEARDVEDYRAAIAALK